MTVWALPEAERLAKQQEGIAAWKAWAEDQLPAMAAELVRRKVRMQ